MSSSFKEIDQDIKGYISTAHINAYTMIIHQDSHENLKITMVL
uniref:Uncharacterized protein n=1 Tax=Meloidogyne enterolobii TaxID=390850 RepID=A0A6V7X6F0_MELEN|nr:unnamed protein product [Meloidogyne enterolobii]